MYEWLRLNAINQRTWGELVGYLQYEYIGVFLTFYWFKRNFDQGGFASFVLLCGITVNASIHIPIFLPILTLKKKCLVKPKAML